MPATPVDARARPCAELQGEVLAGHTRDRGDQTDDLYSSACSSRTPAALRGPDGRARSAIAHRHPVLDARVGVEARRSRCSPTPSSSGPGRRRLRRGRTRLAQRAGFDFVDVKCCHGYLLHELLGARGRRGPYGGSFENRTRLFRRIVDEIRSATGDFEIGVRVSLADVFPHTPDPDTKIGGPRDWEGAVPYESSFGVDPDDPRRFDLTEPLRFLELVHALGIRLVNVTLGSPYWCPHLQRPAAYPPSDGYLPPRDPLCEVAEHLRVTRAAKRAFPDLVLVGTGYTYLQEWLPHVAQHEVRCGHVDFVGLGRMVLSYPELPRDVLAGRPLDRRRICRTFSDCTTGPRAGLPSGCYPLDPHYRERPEALALADVKAELRAQNDGPN